jgi:pimeloyl-ACP methyl ester carboxylesterase
MAALIASMDELSSRQYTFSKGITLIWGADDQIVPLKTARRLRKTLPNARLHILEKCGHLPTIERPKRFRRIWKEELM